MVCDRNPASLSGGKRQGTDHETPFSYDTHVPLAFYGLAFQPGIYRTHAEPVDLAVTLASLLGINAPAQATGRVLTEALRRRIIPPSGARAPPTDRSAAPAPRPPGEPNDAGRQSGLERQLRRHRS
jgi:arylsulfatase A-like enzyme